MAYVVCAPCADCRDKSCLEVCPTTCLHDAGDRTFLDPDCCIDCAACADACPAEAIFPESDVPREWRSYIELNSAFFRSGGRCTCHSG
jgi:NAD-dependent dihydropyrimidine dehydrogenase PreA subunit